MAPPFVNVRAIHIKVQSRKAAPSIKFGDLDENISITLGERIGNATIVRDSSTLIGETGHLD